jgi:hypothetical protein
MLIKLMPCHAEVGPAEDKASKLVAYVCTVLICPRGWSLWSSRRHPAIGRRLRDLSDSLQCKDDIASC